MWAFSRFVRYFEEAARRGSMRRAGESLHVSASSIDRQILRIEEELGVPLFERLPQGLKLTAAGELVLHKARTWQNELQTLVSQIEDLKGLRRGHVRLAIVEGAAYEFASRVNSAFHRRYPGVSFDLQILGSAQVVKAMLEGNVDFGLTMNPPALPGLRVVATAEFRLGIVVPPGHALLKKPNLRLADCQDHALVMADASLGLRTVIDGLLAKSSVRPQVIATSNSIMALKDLVVQGMGIGLMTEMDARKEIDAGLLCFARLHDTAIQNSVLSACVATERQLSLAASGLLTEYSFALKGAQPMVAGLSAVGLGRS
jgi:DNA-binding transcriptional LysR family regulator